ncbi:MAG: hypothetical protein RUMPE_00785 [Eubacteriales bacterium SKADARSKE-1]|nr:hypothetical protein [Eubacteriales bacterium SKADARSKE-1]
MKKVLSSVLVGIMLISSMGAISIFAGETEAKFSATAEVSSEIELAKKDLNEAIGKLKENIEKLEVKSFWQRNKYTILALTFNVLTIATAGSTFYVGHKFLVDVATFEKLFESI